jgi:hypothetical protein
MADLPTSEAPSIPSACERAETYQVFVDEVHRFSDEQWRRSQVFETRAMQLMASSAVIAGVTFTFISRSDLPAAVVALFAVGTVLLIASIVSCAVVLLPRKVVAADPRKLTDLAARMRDDHIVSLLTTLDRLMLLQLGLDQDGERVVGRAGARQSIPECLAIDASRRSRWLTAGIAAFTGGAVILGIACVVQLIGR